jgi:DNA-binding GntR family transcriptional regulator
MDMSFSEIESSARITDVVFNKLRDAILSGELVAGRQLSVPELARQLGVSRSPVREAVLQLVAHGLGQSEPRKGVIVAQLDEEALVGNHEIREVLEGLSARRAAARITADDLSALDELMALQKKASQKNDPGLYVETDEKFHRHIAMVSGHGGLRQFLHILNNQMRLNTSVAMSRRGHIDGGYKEHLVVLEALRAHDPAWAEEAMRQHIGNARMRLSAILSAGRIDPKVTKGKQQHQVKTPRASRIASIGK